MKFRFFRPVVLSFFLMMPAMSGLAQQREILNNKGIVEMTKAGLGSDIILTKIETSTCRFDLSTTQLIELKKQGVSEDIIAAMMDKSKPKTATTAGGTGAPANRRPTASRQLQIGAVNYVHAVAEGQAIPLEKQVAGMRTKTKAFGYGGVSAVYEINGETSTVKIPLAGTDSFVINTGGAAPDFALYRLKVEKKKRHAVSMSANTFSGTKTGEGVLTLTISKISDGVYRLVPDHTLEKGEYYFASKAVSSTNSLEVFAFTVE